MQSCYTPSACFCHAEIQQGQLTVTSRLFICDRLRLGVRLFLFLLLLGGLGYLGGRLSVVGLRHKLFLLLLILLGVWITEIILCPLVAQIVRNITAIPLTARAWLNTACFEFVLNVIPCLAADILKAVDH